MTKTQSLKPQKRLGVCLSHDSNNQALIDAALEIIAKEQCSWYAVYIENEDVVVNSIARQRLEQSLDNAREAGAILIRLPSNDTAQGIITAAELHKLTHVIIGKGKKSYWANLIKPTLAAKILTHNISFEVQVITINKNSSIHEMSSNSNGWVSYFASASIILLITAIVEVVQESLPEYKFNAAIYNVSMLYLLAIIFCSLRFGLGPAMLAGILSFGFYNFFFITPFYEFGLGQISDVLNLALFLSASLISATVANAYKNNMLLLREREQAARALYNLSKDIAGFGNKEEVTISLVKHMREILQKDVVLLSYNDSLNIAYPRDVALSDEVLERAEKSYEKQETAHISGWSFYIVSTARLKLGMIGVMDAQHSGSEKLIEALCYQTALAIERAQLTQDSEDMKLQNQKESLRSALLSSVSHDLKTPLVSIIGSLSSLRHMDASFSSEDRKELISTAIEEAERLNQSITNILDMTRIEAGELKPNKEWLDVYSLFASSVERQAHMLEKLNVKIDVDLGLAVHVDPTLFPQVLQNILENAAKYTPEGSNINLSADIIDDNAVLTISDDGPGVPAEQRDKLFDKFTRLEHRDARVAGTGLGLAICKAIIGVHGGTIALSDTDNGKGLSVVISLKEYKHLTHEKSA